MKKISMLLCFSLTTCLCADETLHRVTEFIDQNKVRLEDGSIWLVDDKDLSKIESQSDASYSFTADEAWFENKINCFLQPLGSNKKIAVSLVSEPNSYDTSSHWIAYLEPKKSILFLDNGAVFSLYDNDREYFKNWLPDDFVLVGNYSSWMSQSKHILFNYRTKEYIFGELHH